ncbi:MAG: hypothetical protein WCB27_07105 [Thermoguttaceae bacterium]|jgi:hypothetical protein
MSKHWFWAALTIACVVWYSTITVYVSIKGVFDIKHMLARLSKAAKNAADDDGKGV